jgi:hypothetical protein
LKVLLCNVSDTPISGKATLWRLEPGEYELTFGPDANDDDQPDRVERNEKLTVVRGDEIKIDLPPKVVQVLELKQVRKLEPIFNRADLAVAQRELKIDGGKITGVVHNIGTREVDDVQIAIVDDEGKTIETKHLGRLAAPLDLQPKTIAFELAAPPGVRSSWSIIVDPAGVVPEIYEGNNRLRLATQEHRQ